MSRVVDLLVIGAGPAGMGAAVRARASGLEVLVVDEQPAPGGQIWRGVEARAGTPMGALLGKDYTQGLSLVQAFRASGAQYEPGTQVWQLEPGWRVYMSRGQRAECVQAANVLLATGAQERAVPFPGWTLPGVMTVGAAQILMKNAREIPQAPVWIAGSGPLVLLYMVQLLRAGGRIAGWLDTSPARAWRRGLPHARAALGAWRELRKGVWWMLMLRRAGVPVVRGVTQLRAQGDQRLQGLSWRTADGRQHQAAAQLLLVHEGVVPSIHVTQALDCAHAWNGAQQCWAPVMDSWGQTSQPGIFVAGDGAGIGGAGVARARGELAALGIALRAGRLQEVVAGQHAAPCASRLRGDWRCARCSMRSTRHVPSWRRPRTTRSCAAARNSRPARSVPPPAPAGPTRTRPSPPPGRAWDPARAASAATPWHTCWLPRTAGRCRRWASTACARRSSP
jgi:thioredoxin reductase